MTLQQKAAHMSGFLLLRPRYAGCKAGTLRTNSDTILYSHYAVNATSDLLSL